MANKQKHSNEYYFLLALVGLVVVLVPIVLLRFSQMTVIQRVNKSMAVVSPTGVLTKAKRLPVITDVDPNTRKVTLPEYKISFEISAKFLEPAPNSYNYYPNSSTSIYITSPDAKSEGNGATISGVDGTISIYRVWNGFSNELPANKPVWGNFIVDNSIFQGVQNPLITTATARAYKLGLLELKINQSSSESIGFSMDCYDHTAKIITDSRCPAIEKTILSTLQIIK